MLKIKSTTYPDQKFTSHKEWREHLTAEEYDSIEKFRKDFDRIWSDFKLSIVDARTKKR